MAENKVARELYPTIKIERIQNPKKFWAVPVIGFIIKIFTIIPISFLFSFVSMAVWFLSVINSVYVLVNGKYWQPAYEFAIGSMQVNLKIYCYLLGLTDKFPGFVPRFAIQDAYSMSMAMPQNPNKLFAIPIFGGLARIILLIPYLIYSSVLQNAAFVGAIYSSFFVLGKGEYQESSFEIVRDSVRISLATNAYFMGLSDTYPSFWISMNHKTAKIMFIILGILMSIMNSTGNTDSDRSSYNENNTFQQYMDEVPPSTTNPEVLQ